MHARTSALRTLTFATVLLAATTACGGADTGANEVDTGGVTAVGSGTGAGDSARAGGVSGTFMGDTTKADSVLGDSAGRDTLNRRPGSTRP